MFESYSFKKVENFFIFWLLYTCNFLMFSEIYICFLYGVKFFYFFKCKKNLKLELIVLTADSLKF